RLYRNRRQHRPGPAAGDDAARGRAAHGAADLHRRHPCRRQRRPASAGPSGAARSAVGRLMRAALIQLTVTDDPAANLEATQAFTRQAVEGGAGFVLTPEMTNCLSSSRDHQRAIFRREEGDETLAGLRRTAKEHGIWLLVGSLGLLTQDEDGRFANRSFLIAPDGNIAARYDKIH